MLPARAICDQARRSRDARFDGVFFTAVKTTGIYCRPVCPAPAPKDGNLTYFANAASAEAAGYRPCLRCRPELSPADGLWRRGDSLVARATRLIEDGCLDDAPLAHLAERLHVGERHLRRVLTDALGTSPQQLQATRRLLFAKQLLSETTLPVTQVAEAAGFQSLRRFNDAFAKAYGMPPSRLRKAADAPPAAGPLVLRLAYRPPFDFRAALAFLQPRALTGIERVEPAAYARMLDATGSWLHLAEWGRSENALRLSLHGVVAGRLPSIVRNVRRMFDLDADPHAIHAHLGQDPMLRPLLAARPGLRLPGGWGAFEVAIRAVLGQQVSVVAATTLARRLVHAFGQPLQAPVDDDLHALFPVPDAIAEADLAGIGLTGTRIATVKALAHAVAEGRVDCAPEQSLEDFIARWTALPGIGDWTAHYIAMRALGHPDAFPAGDLVLRKQAGGGMLLAEKTLRARAEAWRPWRAYAAIQLWHAAASPPSRKEPKP